MKKLKLKGAGSRKLYIKKCDNEIYDLLRNDYELSVCNIEIRPKGIIIYIKSNLETYGLIIPYYKLVIFKVGDEDYTINVDANFLNLNNDIMKTTFNGRLRLNSILTEIIK